MTAEAANEPTSPGAPDWIRESDKVQLLLDMSRAMASTLDPDALYGLALDRLRELIPFRGAVVGIRTPSGWVQAAARRPADIGEDEIERLPGWAKSAWVRDISAGKAFIVDDIRGDDPKAVEYRAHLLVPIEESPMRYFRSIMEVPMVLNGRTVGEVSVSHEQPGFFTSAHMELVSAVASFLAIAMENARLFAEAGNRAHELTTLLELSRAVTSTLDLEELYETALDRLRDIIPYVGASIGVGSGGERRQVAARRPPEVRRFERSGRAGWYESEFLSRVARGEWVRIDDIRSDEPLAVEFRAFFDVPVEISTGRWFRSVLSVPLTAGGKTIGDLSLSHDEPGYFQDGHVGLALSVANHIAIAIENARLYAEAEERANALATLLELSKSVTSTLDLEELYEVALAKLGELIPYSGANIGIRTSDGPRQVAARRPAGIDPGPVLRRDGWYESAFMSELDAGRPVLVGDVRGDEPMAVDYRRYLIEPIEASPLRYVRSLVCVPLGQPGRLIGELAVGHETPHVYGPEHVQLVASVANHVSIGIENARLYAQAAERASALAALLELSTAVTSTLDLEQLYDVALRRLRDLVPYTGASVGLITPDGPRLVAASRMGDGGTGIVEQPDDWQESPLMKRVAAGQRVILDDARGDDPLAVEYRSFLAQPIEKSAMSYVRSLVCVPLTLQDRVIGQLSVAHSTPGFFDGGHVELISSIANHIAIAIENARLYTEATERTREMTSLLEISRSVAGAHDSEALARVVLDEFRNVMDFGNASLVLREGPLLRIAYANSRADPRPRNEVIGVTFEVARAGPIWERLAAGEPLVVADNRDGGYWSRAYQRVVGDLYDTAFRAVRSWLGVPLRVRGETIGFMTISAPKPGQFGQAQIDLAMAFAAQVSVAFENTELLRQAQSVAATEERQRLARELHDSVSQALYGIALGARTARTQLERDATAAVEPIDYVLSLAEAGLAEMRALIFELRPESLANEGLVAALEKQVTAIRARYGLQVRLSTSEEPGLPIPAKEAMYRVAQEAMHNVVKHARAATVNVTLSEADGTVELRVADDGAGFDPNQEFPGHLGLQSMRERAASAGGALTVTSAPGTGTTVAFRLPRR